MSKPIRIAVVGSGAVAFKSHFPELARLAHEGRVQLELVCDLDIDRAKRAKEQFGFRAFSANASDALQDTIDAVYIFSSVDLHFSLGKKVLQYKKHLFLEKPPAPTLADFDELIDEAKKSGVVAVVGFNRRFDPGVSRIAAYCRETAEPVFIEAVFNKPAVDIPAPYGTTSWMYANSIHAVDVMVFLKGAPATVQAIAGGRNKKNGQLYIHTALCTWEDGSRALFFADNAAGEKLEKYSLHLPGETITAAGQKVLSVQDGKERELLAYNSMGFAEEHDAFVFAIEDRTNTPIHKLEAVRPSIELALSIQNQIAVATKFDLQASAITPPQETIQKPIQSNFKKGSILVLAPGLFRDSLPNLHAEFGVVVGDQTPQFPVRAVLTGAGSPLPESIFEKYPSLEFVSVAGASLRKYNARQVVERGVSVFTASAAYADAVAEFQVMQAIAGLRRAVVGHDVLRAGGWGFAYPSWIREFKASFLAQISSISFFRQLKKVLPEQWEKARISIVPPRRPETRSLKGVTVGMVGFGNITKSGIKKFSALGASVVVHSSYASTEELSAFGATRVGLADAMRADVVIINRGLSQRTEKSIGREELDLLKPGAVFINASRGKVIDEDALIARLEQGDVVACLDVFSEEPLPKHSKLRALRNVFLTPHVAGSTREMYEDARKSAVDAVCSFMRGEPVAGVISTVEHYDNMT